MPGVGSHRCCRRGHQPAACSPGDQFMTCPGTRTALSNVLAGYRIGQTEVCHMWNLVAADTREAQVYLRLSPRSTSSGSHSGQVFRRFRRSTQRGRAATAALGRHTLRRRSRVQGPDQPGDRRHRRRPYRDAIEHPPLAEETLALHRHRAHPDRDAGGLGSTLTAPLHPQFFLAAMDHLGGKATEREPGRFQLASVPSSVR